MISNTELAVGRCENSTVVAPTDMGNAMAFPMPYEKKSFAAENTTSSSRMPMTRWPISRAAAINVVWTCLTPLGSPVEPDVYIQNATSSESVGATNLADDPRATRSAKSCTSSSANAARSSALASTRMIVRSRGSPSRMGWRAVQRRR